MPVPLTALVTVASAALGCGSTDGADALAPPISTETVDDIYPDTRATAIEFQPATELEMVAGETVLLTVVVTPPGEHTVRFALLGETDDAFLNPSVVDTGPDGVAQTSLTALSPASRFTVRAAASRVETTASVVTLAASQATLVVAPSYAGSRPVERWAASVHLNETCANLEGVPFPDGLLLSTGESAVRIEAVPAEVPLAVVVRAGQFAGGCRSVTPLRAGSESTVSVDVTDRPMETDDLSLALSFGVEPAEAPHPALDELAFRAVSPLVGTASDDLAALLDAMSAASEDPTAFEQARAARAWRAALVAGLAPELPGSGLRSMVQAWMRSGIEQLEQPDALRGTLVSLDADGSAALTLESVIGLSPEATGFERVNAASALAETEDFLRLGVTLEWEPSLLLSEAANLAALVQHPEQPSAAAAMAERFGCEDVADILVDSSDVPGEAFPGCDEDCSRALCEAAMVELWSRVAGSALPALPWQISGAARAQVDESARPTHVEGTWVGTLTVPDFGTSPIGGPFSGVAGN